MATQNDTASTGTSKNVSKRTRYEVLNRDGFACQYCGGKAPDVKLAIDHVIPVALGGDNKPSNLVTACVDCNAGKGASNPDSDLVQRLSAEAATYALEMANKYAAISQRLADEEAMLHLFDVTWGDQAPVPHDYRQSVRRFHRMGVPPSLVEYAIETAMGANHVYPASKFKYMAGVIYRTLEQEDVSFTLGDKKVRLYTEAEYTARGSQSYQDGAHDWGNYVEAKAQYTDPLARHIDKQSQVAVYQPWDFNCRDWDADARARLEAVA